MAAVVRNKARLAASPAPSRQVTMREALEDTALLGSVLEGDTWMVWRAMLIALMGEALTDDERVIFEKFTGRPTEPLQRVDELWAVVGRRGGKSRAISVLAIFLAVFRDYSGVTVSGEKPTVLIMSPTTKQSGVIFSYIAGTLDDNPMLAKLVRTRTAESLELANGVTIEVRPASFRGVRGVTCVAAIGDEVAFWLSDDTGSSNPDTAILDAVRPSLATTGGPLICISSPYAKRGAVYSAFRESYGPDGDPLILVAKGASRDFNPSLPQKVVDRAMARDPAAASAEYLGQFRDDIEGFITREVVEACVSPHAIENLPMGARYFGFVDPSGGSRDSFTMAIAHREGDVAVLDLVRDVKPPFSPEQTVGIFAATLQRYGITTVRGDRYAGEWPREQFRNHGIAYQPSDKSKSELYVELLPHMHSRAVRLLNNETLINQLTGLERRTSRAGKDSIDHAPGAHDDVANAVAGALVAASVKPMEIRCVRLGLFER